MKMLALLATIFIQHGLSSGHKWYATNMACWVILVSLSCLDTRAFGAVPEAVHACTCSMPNVPHALIQCELVLHHMHAWYSKQSESCIVCLPMHLAIDTCSSLYISRKALQPCHKVCLKTGMMMFACLKAHPRPCYRAPLGLDSSALSLTIWAIKQLHQQLLL